MASRRLKKYHSCSVNEKNMFVKTHNNREAQVIQQKFQWNAHHLQSEVHGTLEYKTTFPSLLSLYYDSILLQMIKGKLAFNFCNKVN